MEMAPGFRAKSKIKIKKHLHCGGAGGGGIGLDTNTLMVIKLPDSLVLRIIGRSFLLAMFIIALPCIGPIFHGPSNSYVDDYESSFGSDSIDFELLNMVIRDLAEEGLIKRGDKALISVSGIEAVAHNLRFLGENEIDVIIMGNDTERQSSIADGSFDLVFISSFQDVEFIDRVVKTGGIVAVLLGNSHLKNAFQERSNYEIVYLSRFSFTIVAMIKSSSAKELASSSTKRRLCALALASKTKNVAVNDLEDALQPPQLALAKSNKYLKISKYLPDLFKASLKSYGRRIFSNAGSSLEENESFMEWFIENYSHSNQDFQAYNLEIVAEDKPLSWVAWQFDILDWLVKNAREGKYVMMKAEAKSGGGDYTKKDTFFGG